MKTFFKNAILFFLFLFFPNYFVAQDFNQNYLNYIETYKSLAFKIMTEYKIPSSITLAQGILESGAGQSKFVKETNNHFGIKCHSDWNGAIAYHIDEQIDECFRKYNTAEEAFEDHALFLLKKRYASLFKLDIKDYVGWANGLQEYGYATDKFYAKKLIKIIKDYELFMLDSNKELNN